MLSGEGDPGSALAREVTGPVPRRDVRVPAGEVELHCILWGREQDPPVLLVHGNGAHAHWWDPLVPRLARGRRLLALDLRGHGESGRPHAIAYRLTDYERDFLALQDALAPGPVPVIAHSMGARAAVHFAARHPERVAGLALIDTHFTALRGDDVAAFRTKVRDNREGRPYPSYAHAMAAYRLVPDEPGVPEAVMRDVAHHALVERTAGEWWVRFDRGVLLGDGAGDVWDVLARVRCPVRVAYAQRAPEDDRGERATLRARFPHVRVDVLEGGHHMFLARPGPVGEWLAEFLDALPGGA